MVVLLAWFSAAAFGGTACAAYAQGFTGSPAACANVDYGRANLGGGADPATAPNPDGAALVGVGIFVTQLSSLDAVREEYSFRGHVRATWCDPRLAFDPDEVGALERVYIGGNEQPPKSLVMPPTCRPGCRSAIIAAPSAKRADCMRIGQRLLLRAGFVGTIMTFAFATPALAADKPEAITPNILLIMADDLGYTDLGAFGGEIQTPHVDALAERGLLFSSFHTSVSCSPTRSTLMTGTDNHIAGLGNMDELLTPEQRGKPGYEGHLNERVVSLAEVLRDGGYHTYMAGKWHLGDEPEHFPHARGFERSFSMLQGGASHWSDMVGLQATIQPVAKYVIDDKVLDELPADFYSSRSYADFLMDAVRENRGDGKPFLAYFAPTAAHDPIHVPEPWLSKYRGQYDDGYEALKSTRIAGAKRVGLVPRSAPAPGRHPRTKPWDSLSSEEKALESRMMEAYAGMVENMDYHIGRFVDFLKDIGEFDNTIVIFTSDNGPNPLSSEEYPGNADTEWMRQFDNSLENVGRPGSFVGFSTGWASASAGPLDYFKLTVGEGGIRTPLIIGVPGVKSAREVDGFAYVTDIMPTILELAGLEHPDKYRGRNVERMSGRSLAGVTSGSQEDTYAEDALIGGEMINGKWMRKGDYKAVLVAKPLGPGSWRLYNTAKDPGETVDLSREQPAMLGELKAGWDQYAKDVGVVPSK